MRLPTVAVILAVLAVVVGVLLNTGEAQPAGGPRAAAVRVGVCDVEAVMNGYQRAIDIKNKLVEEDKAFQKELDKQAESIKHLQDIIKKLGVGSKPYLARMEELKNLSIIARIRRETHDQLRAMQFRQLTQDMYRQAIQAVETIAKSRRLDLVLFRENVDIDSKTTRELFTKIAQRKCLYSSPSIDITKAVMDRLNKAYKAAAPKK